MSTKKKKILPKDLNGIFVYHEEKRTVYAPPFSRRGYIISDSNIDQYVSYVQAYLIAIIIFVVAYIIYRLGKYWNVKGKINELMALAEEE